MEYYVGLDVSLKQTAICVVDGDCEVVWQGCADTHPEMILNELDRWAGKIARLGLETGSITPWLARALKARGLPVIVMDARRASDAMKARPVKTDHGAGVRGGHRGPGPVPPLARCGRLSGPDAKTLSVRRARCRRRDQQTGGCDGAALPLRGGELPADHLERALGAEELGNKAGQAGWPQEGARRGGAQAGLPLAPALEGQYTL